METDALGQINTPTQHQTLLSPAPTDILVFHFLIFFFSFSFFSYIFKVGYHSTKNRSLSTSWVAAPWTSLVAQMVKNLPANAGDAGDMSSVPGLDRSPREGNGNSLQYSCLGNPMDRGAWWANIHKVAKTWTQLRTHAAWEGAPNIS